MTADDDLVHVQCTGVEACAQISKSWATVGGVCVGVDGGLDCVRPSYTVQVTGPAGPVNSSVTQPQSMGALQIAFNAGHGPSAGTVAGGAGQAGTPNGDEQQKLQQQKDKVGHGCTIVSGLLVLGDAVILFSGQEELAPWSLSLSLHVWAACGWVTW